MKTTTSFAPLLERFFTQRLMQQRQASPHTISSYRDTFRLLLKFAQQRLHTTPAQLTFEAIDAPLITAFLAHLEKHRGLSARCLRSARPRCPDPTCVGHPQQTLYTDTSALPHSPRDQGVARCARSADVVRPTRSRIPPGGCTDWAPFVGDDWADTQRCHAWHRCPHSCDRERAKGTVCTTSQVHSCSSESLAS